MFNATKILESRIFSTKSGKPALSTYITLVAVAISTLVMVITTAIICGFNRQIEYNISSFTHDVVVTDIGSIRYGEGEPIIYNDSLKSIVSSCNLVTSIYPYISVGAVIRSNSGAVGTIVKGVESADQISKISQSEVKKFGTTRRKELFITSTTAKAINVEVGDKVELLTLGDKDGIDRNIFIIGGIYSSPFDSEGTAIALTDIRNSAKIKGYTEGQISGLELDVANFGDCDIVATSLNDSLLYYGDNINIGAISAKQLYPNLFSWLATHDVNGKVVVIIMIIVALFNILTALLILILERTKVIGILESLGTTTATIRMVFLWRTIRLTIYGIIIGDMVALILGFIEQKWHIITLDQSAYFLNYVPISFSVTNIVAINIIFAVATIVVMWVATSVVQSISPAKAVKYE